MQHTKLFSLTLLAVILSACNDDNNNSSDLAQSSTPDFIQYKTTTPLLPEGIAHDTQTNTYFVSSASTGAITRVNTDGSNTTFIDASVFKGNASFGLAIDDTNNRLLAVSSNLQDPTHARLFIFDKTTGETLHEVDLAVLTPGLSFANDVTVDNNGNAYVTNSDQGVIYKVTLDGSASIFFQDDSFAPSSPATESGFNGIAFHSNGYLLLAHSATNKIYKLALTEGAMPQEITLPTDYLSGPDGIAIANNKLIVINNTGLPFVSQFNSSDDWSSGSLEGDTYAAGDTFPTTATIVNDEAMVSHSYFNYPGYGLNPLDYQITKANFDTEKRYTGSATDIPRIFTPIKPFGYGDTYPEPFYANCSTPLADTTLDLRGDWMETEVIINGQRIPVTETGAHKERIEQCGNRVLIISNQVLHEFFMTDDTAFNGVNDANPAGQPVHSSGKFSNNSLILTPVLPTALNTITPNVTRELSVDDTGNAVLKFFNPQLITERYLTRQTSN